MDLLILEGTTLSREQVKSLTEEELALKISEQVKPYSQIFLLCSTTNIDRITVMTKVAMRTRQSNST